jgi:hypothetical protein
MKFVKPCLYALLIAALSALAVSCTSEKTEPGAAAPSAQQVTIEVPTMLDGALVTIVVGDMPGLIDKGGVLVSKVAPGMDAAAIKAKLGTLVNDPEIETSFPPGSGMVVAVLEGNRPLTFVEINPKVADAYVQKLAKRHAVTEVVGGVLLIANTKEDLTAAKGILDEVNKNMLAGAGKSTVEVTVNLPKICELYDQQIQQLIQTIAAQLAAIQSRTGGGQQTQEMMQNAGRILEGEMRAIYYLAKQVEVLHFSLEPQDNGLRISKTVVPLPDTGLATLLNASVPPFPEDLMKMLPGKGAIRGAYSVNAEALADFSEKVANVVLEQMNITVAERESIINWMKKSVAVYGDGAAMDMMIPGGSLVSGSIIMKSKDPASVLNFLESMGREFESSGLAAFYESMGMPMKFEVMKDVRQYNGVAIHVMKMDMEMKGMPADEAEKFREMMGEMKYDIALLDNVAVYAIGGERIEELIDAVKAGSNPEAKPLAAQSVFAPGAKGYFDIGIGEFVNLMKKSAAISMPSGAQNPFEGIANLFKDVEPITLAAYLQDGKIKVSMMMPASLFEKIGQAVQGATAPGTGANVPAQSKQN